MMSPDAMLAPVMIFVALDHSDDESGDDRIHHRHRSRASPRSLRRSGRSRSAARSAIPRLPFRDFGIELAGGEIIEEK